jgi:transposase-like protein
MKITQLVASTTTAALLGTAGVSIAGATADRDSFSAATAAAPASEAAERSGRKAHLRAARRHALEVAAEAIGVSPGELVAELRTGKTIAQVAQAHGVAPPAVVDALVGAANDKITAAEESGKLTAEKAAKLRERAAARAERFVTATRETKAGKEGRKARHRHAARHASKRAVKVAADAIGVSPEELVAELRAGKTVAQVAESRGVAPQVVIDAIVAAAEAKIAAAEESGKLTSERAAELRERIARFAEKLVNEGLGRRAAGSLSIREPHRFTW